MNKQEVVKVQACVLRVNIHCDGCKKKVKKLLQSTEGVYTVTIDADQGKVTVTGAVDPDKLIKKLEKSGKHAELWGGAAPKNNASFNFNNLNNQFKNLGLGNGKSDKSENKKLSSNVGKDQSKQQQIVKEMVKDIKSSKEQKNVKFNLPKESKFEESGDDFVDEFSDDDYDDDGGDDGLDDMFGDGHGHAHSHDKKGSVVNISDSKKPSKESGKDKKDAKKGGGGFDIPSFMKGLGLKSGGSKSVKNEGKKKKNGGDGDGKDKKKGCKHGDNDNKKNSNDGGGKNKGDDNGNNKGSKNGGKKGGAKNSNDHHDGFHLPNNKGFDEINHITNMKGGGGGGYMGQMGSFPMGQMRSVPAVQGLPAMNGGGYYQNPNPQQYMGMNMNMNPNMMNHQGYVQGNDMFHPMMYARPNQPAGYVPPMPPPVADPYVHMFSDENASGCSIM